MAKWADFLISHVKHDNQMRVTHVLLHSDEGETVRCIGVKTKDEIITLLKRGNRINTITWGYPKWNNGAVVGYVLYKDGEYLRTDKNNTSKDNLDNLIPLVA